LKFGKSEVLGWESVSIDPIVIVFSSGRANFDGRLFVSVPSFLLAPMPKSSTSGKRLGMLAIVPKITGDDVIVDLVAAFLNGVVGRTDGLVGLQYVPGVGLEGRLCRRGWAPGTMASCRCTKLTLVHSTSAEEKNDDLTLEKQRGPEDLSLL